MAMHHFWASFASNNFFFKKSFNKSCFFYSCLSACQKSKSDINLSVKYWWFKSTEISLAESYFAFFWELDFFQACSFPRMLMNHKNFDFTQIPDKTNDAIFLKSPKTIFFGHFVPFLPDWDFFQKIRLCQTQLYMDP